MGRDFARAERAVLGVKGELPAGERVAGVWKPSLWWVVLRTPGRIVGLLVGLVGVMVFGLAFGGTIFAGTWVIEAGVLVVGLAGVIAWNVLQYEARWYVLMAARGKAGRVMTIGGVIGRFSSEAPLHAVRSVAVVRVWYERLLGVGDVGFATAGTGSYEVVWAVLDRPSEVVERVRREISVSDAEAGRG